MKVVVRRGLKLDLPIVLAFVRAFPGVPSSTLLPAMMESFQCSRRAAQDALRILVVGGWLERRDDENDRRRKLYYVTEKGERDVQTWDGWREMRLSRWRYSSTSTRARQRRERQSRTPGFQPAERYTTWFPRTPARVLAR